MHTPFHIRGRISNLRERMLLAIYRFCSKHMLWIIIEPDTTDPNDVDVTNCAITLSNQLAKEICACGINTKDGNVNVIFGCINKDENIYSIEHANYTGSVPIQYCPVFHTWGCQPWFPTPVDLLNWMGLSMKESHVLHVMRFYHYDEHRYIYAFSAPTWHTIWFAPFAKIISRVAFRYEDTRYTNPSK